MTKINKIFIIIFFLFVCSNSWAAIAHIGSDSEGQGTTSDTQFTGTFAEPSGDNRICIICASSEESTNSSEIGTVLYLGQTATLVTGTEHTQNTIQRIKMMYMLESTIAAGSGSTVTVNYTENVQGQHYAMSCFSGAAQEEPGVINTPVGQASATTSTDNITTIDSGSMIVSCMNHGQEVTLGVTGVGTLGAENSFANQTGASAISYFLDGAPSTETKSWDTTPSTSSRTIQVTAALSPFGRRKFSVE